MQQLTFWLLLLPAAGVHPMVMTDAGRHLNLTLSSCHLTASALVPLSTGPPAVMTAAATSSREQPYMRHLQLARQLNQLADATCFTKATPALAALLVVLFVLLNAPGWGDEGYAGQLCI
jgi:hypothetical protein